MRSVPRASAAVSATACGPHANRLISRLPQPELKRFMAQCETVELARDTVLCTAQSPLTHAYFPLVGSISMVTRAAATEIMETRHIGNEGVLGATLALGIVLAPQLGRVQSSGLALRLSAGRMRHMLGESPVLNDLLRRYLFVVLMQAARSVCCARFHHAGSRLAKALLVAHDQAQSARFCLTHEVLADMLGVQRGAVTLAAGLLQKCGAISYVRGNITVVDRRSLESKACVCYGLEIADYSRQFPAGCVGAGELPFRDKAGRLP